MASIHETAIVDPGARIARGVRIGPFAQIGPGVEIGENSVIEGRCELGLATGPGDGGALVIGAGSHIRSGAIFYAGSRFGDGLVTGHRVTVRERVEAGPGLQIGTLGDLQGHCRIGAHVRLHSNVHVGQGSRIDDYVWIFPYVVLTNDPHPPSETRLGCHLQEFAVVSTMSTVLPGAVVGRGALVGAMTLVRGRVPEDSICVGVPGRVIGPTARITLKATGTPAYPWRRHFHRGYPAAAVAEWRREFPEG